MLHDTYEKFCMEKRLTAKLPLNFTYFMSMKIKQIA